MQGILDFIPTRDKIQYINELIKVGFDSLDCGSFVSPKAIPQMRDTYEVLDKLDLKFKNIIGTPKFCNQKTQIDVVECVSLCILDFVKKKNSFSIKDILFAKFSVHHVYETFRKPISTDKKSQKEFDKFFAHPI